MYASFFRKYSSLVTNMQTVNGIKRNGRALTSDELISCLIDSITRSACCCMLPDSCGAFRACIAEISRAPSSSSTTFVSLHSHVHNVEDDALLLFLRRLFRPLADALSSRFTACDHVVYSF